MLQELDASIGEILATLDRLKLSENTLVIYSSDNGAYVTGESGHKPTGPFRGKKSQLWEGGHRVPFIVRWPGRITPGAPDDLVSTIDIASTVCAAAGVAVPGKALPDSYNLLPAMLGVMDAPRRDHLILMSGTGHLAIHGGDLKYIPNLAHADGWQGMKKKDAKSTAPRSALFDLSKDPGETENLLPGKAAAAKRLAKLLEDVQAKPVTH